jgi:hypothetical protein
MRYRPRDRQSEYGQLRDARIASFLMRKAPQFQLLGWSLFRLGIVKF